MDINDRSSHREGGRGASSRTRIFFFIGLISLIILGLLVYGFESGIWLQQMSGPQLDAVHEIKLEATTVRLMIDEIQRNRLRTDPERIWNFLDQAILYYKAVLENNAHSSNLFEMTLSPSLFDELDKLEERLNDVKAATQVFLSELHSGNRSLQAQQHYVESFYQFSAQLRQLDDQLQSYIDMHLRRFLVTQSVLIAAIILIALLTAFAFHRYTRQILDQQSHLESMNESLQKEIERREQATSALKEQEELFRVALDMSPEAVSIVRLGDDVCIYVNKRLDEQNGSKWEEPLDAPPGSSQWLSSSTYKTLKTTVQAQGLVRDFEVGYRDQHGKPRTGLVSAREIAVRATPHVLIIASDITDRKQSEIALKSSHRFLEIANRTEDMGSLLDEFAHELKSLTTYQAVGVRLLDEEGKIPFVCHAGFPSEFIQSEEFLSIHDRRCLCSRIIQGIPAFEGAMQTPFGSFVTDSITMLLSTMPLEQRTQLRGHCGRHGYESIALIPIKSGEAIMGLIHAASTARKSLSETVIERVEQAGMQLAIAISRIKAKLELEAINQELENKIRERTASYQRTNDALKNEISRRTKAEVELRGYHERLRSLSSKLLLTEERERRRIATEIHDRIGQSLALCKIRLGILMQSSVHPQVHEGLLEFRRLIEQTIRDTRTLTFELSPPVLYELGLEAAVEWLAEKMEQQHELKILVEYNGKQEGIDNEIRVFAYQAVRELLFNIAKHADASHATVTIGGSDEAVFIGVIDNGNGFKGSPSDHQVSQDEGFGLFSIREHLRSIGGQMEIESEPAKGTHVTLKIRKTSVKDA